jgi:hypothetical protein
MAMKRSVRLLQTRVIRTNLFEPPPLVGPVAGRYPRTKPGYHLRETRVHKRHPVGVFRDATSAACAEVLSRVMIVSSFLPLVTNKMLLFKLLKSKNVELLLGSLLWQIQHSLISISFNISVTPLKGVCVDVLRISSAHASLTTSYTCTILTRSRRRSCEAMAKSTSMCGVQRRCCSYIVFAASFERSMMFMIASLSVSKPTTYAQRSANRLIAQRLF